MNKIMIVDDNPDIVETLKNIMESQSYKVESANNGEELLSKIEKFNPDVLLLDIMMPGLTTKDILNKLKERELELYKIILVTAVRFGKDDFNELSKDYKNLKDYVAKPFDVVEIINKVKTYLK